MNNTIEQIQTAFQEDEQIHELRGKMSAANLIIKDAIEEAEKLILAMMIERGIKTINFTEQLNDELFGEHGIVIEDVSMEDKDNYILTSVARKDNSIELRLTANFQISTNLKTLTPQSVMTVLRIVKDIMNLVDDGSLYVNDEGNVLLA